MSHNTAVWVSNRKNDILPLGKQQELVSIWEGFGVYPWDQLQRVLVVDLFQDFVRNLEAVDAPKRVAAAGMAVSNAKAIPAATLRFRFVIN